MKTTTPLFETNGQPTETFAELLRVGGIVHDGTKAGIKDCLQRMWRVKGKQTGDIPDLHAFRVNSVRPLLEELGFIGEQLPQRKEYVYVLLYGGYILGIRKRLLFAKKLWDLGVTFRHIVLLGGQRPRNNKKEAIEAFNTPYPSLPFRSNWHSLRLEQLPTTEAEIMQVVFDQTLLPSEWRQMPLTIVNAPLFPHREKQDPSAEDTLHSWLETNPLPGTCLGISSQPFVRHVELMSQHWLGLKGFEIDCVGYAAGDVLNVSAAFDAVAKYVYDC